MIPEDGCYNKIFSILSKDLIKYAPLWFCYLIGMILIVIYATYSVLRE